MIQRQKAPYIILLFIIPFFSCSKEICEITSFDPSYFIYEGQIGATGNSTVLAYDNNLLICGNVSDKLTALKISREGSIVWRNDFSREPNGRASGITESVDHDIFICGSVSRNNNLDTNDILLVKLSPVGDTLWSKTYEANYSTGGSRIIQTSDHEILIAARVEDPAQNILDEFVLLKVDFEGNILWQRSYTNGISIFNIIETQDGNFLLTGVGPFQSNQGHLVLVKIDKNGGFLWEKVIGPENKLGHGTIELSNGDLVTCGYLNSPGNNDLQLLVLKTDSLGNVLWEMEYGKPEYGEIGQVILENSDGGFTIAGYAIGVSESGTENILLRIDSAGKLIWCQVFKEDKAGRCENLVKENDGSNIITGWYSGDIFMAKYDND